MAHSSELVASAPPILECILSHLPMRELNSCTGVSKLWCRIARNVKRRRDQLSWMFWVNRSFSHSKRGPVNEISQHIMDVLNNTSIQPKLALLFASNAFFDDQTMFMKAVGDSATPMVDLLMLKLPPDCLLLGTSSDGIVGSSYSCNKCTEVENIPGFSCLLLPEMQGVEIYPFIIKDIEDLNTTKKQALSDDDMLTLTHIPTDKKVKALIVFCSPDQGGMAAHLVVRALLQRQNNQIVLGGGFVDTLVAPKHMLSEHMYLPHTVGIAFCGDNVEAASILLKSSIRRKPTVEEQLMQLKKAGLPEDKSFAFMFACVGRGQAHYKEANVEAEIFHKLFPHTPLFGFFGNGEIGLNGLFTSNGSEAAGSSNISGKKSELFHGYTSIFVFVSIKKPLQNRNI